jgi:hypothetical protein
MAKETKSISEQQKEDWMNAKWRPMMGWTYMATCIFDFILGPILYNMLQYYNPGQAVGMWTPLTLQGGGLYHIAMGAIIGVSAYGRTQEKLNGANNGGLQAPTTGSTSGFTAPSVPSTGFNAAPSTSFTPAPAPSTSFTPAPAPSTSFTPAPSWGTTPVAATAGFGKPMPAVNKPMDTGPLDSDIMPPRE